MQTVFMGEGDEGPASRVESHCDIGTVASKFASLIFYLLVLANPPSVLRYQFLAALPPILS